MGSSSLSVWLHAVLALSGLFEVAQKPGFSALAGR